MSTIEAIKTPARVDAELQRLAHAIRFVSIDAIVRATEGHQGVPLGMAEIATALFTRHLKFNPADPTWPDRDRFVLSNGHGSMLLYALLYLTGYEQISLDQIKTFRELGSHCEGHPEFDPASGIEVTTGPLGQGIANAFGMAVAEAYLNARFGAGLVDHYTYAFVGDGCLQEGIGQEMISLAGHLRLGKLVLFWDDNRITDDGSTTLSMSEDRAVPCWRLARDRSRRTRSRSRVRRDRLGEEGSAAVDDRLPHRDCEGHRALAGTARRALPNCTRKTPRQRGRNSIGRIRRSKCRSRSSARGAPLAIAATPSTGLGASAWTRCPPPNAPSSSACCAANCPPAGATCCTATSGARQPGAGWHQYLG